MPGARRQLLRRGRLVADEMDDVEALRQLDQRDIIGVVAGAAAVHAVMNVGRTGDQAEGDVVVADLQGARRVARRQGEGRGHGLQRLQHDLARDARQAAVHLHHRAGLAEELAGGGALELDADLLQDSQRSVVDRLDLVLAQRRHRRQRVAQRAAGEPCAAQLGGLAGTAGAALHGVSFSGIVGVGGGARVDRPAAVAREPGSRPFLGLLQFGQQPVAEQVRTAGRSAMIGAAHEPVGHAGRTP